MARLGSILSASDDYLDPDERERRARQKERELIERRLTPDWFTRRRDLCIPSGLRVAIVGGGFAGLYAGAYLKACGIRAVVFEAMDRVGGRVWTDRSFIPGKVVEAGAELIGENHPLWRILARQFGLTLIPLTEDDDYERAGLLVRLRFGTHDLTPAEKTQMATELRTPLAAIGADGLTVRDEERPWLARDAARWDSISVRQRLDELRVPASSLARKWIAFTLGNDNCAEIDAQSYLGLVGSVSAARMGSDPRGMLGYWMSTETHRCAGGNDLIASRLSRILGSDVRLQTTVDAIQIQPGYWPPVVVQVSRRDGSGRVIAGQSEAFDFAILATPPTVWSSVRVTPPFPAAGRTIQHGPSIKYLTRAPTAYWIPAGLAPNTRWDHLGSVWESTDGQGSTPGYGLSVFSGGPFVQPTAAYGPKLTQLYPTRPVSAAPPTDRMIDWPSTPHVMTGYGVPGVGQASTVHPAQWLPHQGRLYFAGEQTSPGFFGYMEGALQSGARAARDLISTMVRPCPRPEWIAGDPGGPEPNDGGALPGGTGGPDDSGFRGGGGESGGGGASGEY